jgi:hypothetical protein
MKTARISVHGKPITILFPPSVIQEMFRAIARGSVLPEPCQAWLVSTLGDEGLQTAEYNGSCGGQRRTELQEIRQEPQAVKVYFNSS